MVNDRLKQCPSIHREGSKCCRRAGHDGLCWSRVYLSPTGYTLRAYWRSANGVFVKHHHYEEQYERKTPPRREE